MKYGIAIFAALLLAGCSDPAQETRDWAENSIEYEQTTGGVFRVAFETPYFFGDRVKYKSSVNGSGVGHIEDIGLMPDGQIFYTISPDGTDELQGGIYPDEITLIKRPNKTN